MLKYAIIEKNEFPLVKVPFTGNQANGVNFSLYLNELSETFASKEKLVILFDASKAVFPGLKYQKEQAKWLKENEQLMKNFCMGTAYVIQNLIIRNVLKTIFKFQKQPVPYKVCSDFRDANNWLMEKLHSDK